MIPVSVPDEAWFTSDADARRLLESLRWNGGQTVCPHCGYSGTCYRLGRRRKPESSLSRYKCASCHRSFTVTVNTLFADTNIPLSQWLRAVWLLCQRPQGYTPGELHEQLAVSYKTAWKILQRIRYAAGQKPLVSRRPGAGRQKMRRGAVSLYPVPLETVLAGLLRIVPERKHPDALEWAVQKLESKRNQGSD
jgi:transposase-like protein